MAYYDRALAYAKKRDFDKAVADYTEAIRLKPDLAEAYWGRGNVFEKQRDHLRAIGDYNRRDPAEARPCGGVRVTRQRV